MKVESIIFNIIAVFCVAAAVVYGVWAKEPIGTTALVLSAGLTGMIGAFFWFVSRRIDARPEDRKDAEMADGAGELGFFSPASYWPFALALSAGLMGLALAFFYYWLILIAAAALLITIGGLLFEYYVGQNATQS
ncbi:cytochrome c oxidase subunit 4 [Blastococcus sp. TF02A-30]|uniref:cytochrome c oxidase subunit 4 n=1 Tax=Blastococcus sp. TF02A-30 TaxID=2250580 RepID=UPI000DEBA573|nr:cytochrome c oxidase subunit 4 [Blastococcus sp. TF02A-30]RBY85512.1 cytochrome c oxidase subunit 4 [Blastococcus sp. TF02A-30]